MMKRNVMATIQRKRDLAESEYEKALGQVEIGDFPEETQEEKDVEEMMRSGKGSRMPAFISVITEGMFERTGIADPDLDSYRNGKIEFKDGSIVVVDYMHYKNGTAYDKATVIFLEGEMVKIQAETKLDIEAFKEEIGLTNLPDDAIINELNHGVEISIDPKFVDENIVKFPNEWD
ncbi:hypothetical protein [Paenibacillus sp. MMS18-CY102]|uniref:hypothetical protein n=1 Tax=Paenibacillus sp. MMS18-CY102 TaxID=2682849 RepID=UPI0013663336|nr:hypothetical protein [Paenibacillus sp. MMS18-CY102]MWC30512.1 hypothetical protein [Paenibacillus sp. MMS18-CY102]